MQKLLIVSTPLPPHPCGQGNYTAMINRHWPDDRTKVIHLVTGGAVESRNHLGIDDIYEFQNNYASFTALLERFPDANILLQYAGRGYHKYGCPYWLPLALKQWRKKYPSQSLLVMFHELWASLPVWKKHFLTETLNGKITKDLINLADAVGCLTLHQAERLRSLVPSAKISWIPVGTNIMPTQAVNTSFTQRSPKEFLIFGLQYTRLLTIQELSNSLKKLYSRGLLEQLHLIGPLETRWDSEEKQLLAEILPAHAVKFHGVIPPEQVSQLLHHVGFSIIGQPPENLTKSSTFMAFASHGCNVLSPYAATTAVEPVCYLTHPQELLQDKFSDIENNLVARGQNLWNWYKVNADWQSNTNKIAKMFHDENVLAIAS